MALRRQQEEQERLKKEQEAKEQAERERKEREEAERLAAEQQAAAEAEAQRQAEELERQRQHEEEEAAAAAAAAAQQQQHQENDHNNGDENNNNDDNNQHGGDEDDEECERQQQRIPDPDDQLQPGLRRLLQTIQPLGPTFAAILAGHFKIPWSSGRNGNMRPSPPPFDPLAQPNVKKALRLKGEAAMALHAIAITRANSIVIVSANGFVDEQYSFAEMRKINLVRPNSPDSPCVLIVDLVDPDDFSKLYTAYFVLLTGLESGDRAEMAVKTSFRGIPIEVNAEPPQVLMPDLRTLIGRMKQGVREHDRLIQRRSEVMERLRQLQLQNIARSAVEKLCVDSIEEAPQQERERQVMLNLLVNYICGAESRSKGEFY